MGLKRGQIIYVISLPLTSLKLKEVNVLNKLREIEQKCLDDYIFRLSTAEWPECVKTITEGLTLSKTNGQLSSKLASTARCLGPIHSILTRSSP